MPKAKKGRLAWYAVRVGRRPGVYETWAEAEVQVTKFPGAVHKSFPMRQDAEVSLRPTALIKIYVGTGPAVKKIATVRVASPQKIAVKVEKTDQPVQELSDQQRGILSRVVAGESFFFTGSAGTGKSVLLRAIIAAFKERQAAWYAEARYVPPGLDAPENRWQLAVTASTGMAAVDPADLCNIGGCTLHSWAGIGLGQLPADKLAENIKRNKLAVRRWREVNALIIDEVSMLDGRLLDKLEEIGRIVRSNTEPFGGIQLIVSGDFYQLPPVDREQAGQFAFEAKCWPRIFPSNRMKALTRVYRQRDNAFVGILERMRRGHVLPADVLVLRACDRPVTYADGIEPVTLLSSKAEAAQINEARLAALTTPVQIFDSCDTPGTSSKGYNLGQDEAIALLDRNTIWARSLALKVGALVMLVTNLQADLVNGSTGTVVDFCTLAQAPRRGFQVPERGMRDEQPNDVLFPVVQFAAHTMLIPPMTVTVNNANGGPEASRCQVPLILCWGMTIHKSQGQSIERLRVNLAKIFERGQTYVALSRATNLATLEIKNFLPEKVMAHRKVIEWSQPMEEEQKLDEELEAMS